MRKRKRDGSTANFAADKEFDLVEAPHFLIILLCQWPVYHCLEETCTVAIRIIILFVPLGYTVGIFPPTRCAAPHANSLCITGNCSSAEPYLAAHHVFLAHTAAVEKYREKYQVRNLFMHLQ